MAEHRWYIIARLLTARFYQAHKRGHKKLSDWARQIIKQLRRWLPKRELVVVGDNSYAVIDLLHRCQTLPNPVAIIARLRLDAALYEPAPPYSGKGRPRKKGMRLPMLQTLLTQTQTHWQQVELAWYGTALAAWKSPQIRLSGITQASRLCPSVGS